MLLTSIDRLATASQKWAKYADRDILPMWVADMDFQSPPSVIAALQARVAHGVFGYTDPPASLIEAFTDYASRVYRWRIDPDWIVWLPGLVQGLNIACRAVGNVGDAVLTFTPVYPKFLHAPPLGERQLITVPLSEHNGKWRWDMATLEAAITPHTRLLMLCHPHNPTGRIWHTDELHQLLDVARRYDLVMCSDEVHCDLLLEPGAQHTPFAALDADFATQTITLLAPSKAWNIAGLGCALAIIPDPILRMRFRRATLGLTPAVNLLGYTAAEAAYRDDGAWHSELIETLRINREVLRRWFMSSARLKLTVPQATYLGWIDARAIDAENPLPIFEAHGVGLSDGRDFGLPGFLRLNFGCPTAQVKEALRRLEALR